MRHASACLVLLVLCTAGCASPISKSDTSPTQEAPRSSYDDKKVLWIDSYHKGHEWSDGLESGLRKSLDDTGVEFRIFRMDTARNTDEAYGEHAAQQALAEIERFQPDVIIATDDHAQAYLVAPYLKDTSYPVIFAGVDWDASTYGFPADNVTGIIEIQLVDQLFTKLTQYSTGETVGYLTAKSQSELAAIDVYNRRFFAGSMQASTVETFAEFKQAFMEMQDQADIVLIGDSTEIVGWNEEEAEQFFVENTRTATGTVHAWMTPYALMTLAPVAEEHGEWAAQAALRVLDGTPVSEIAVAENTSASLILNLDIAEQLGVIFTPSILRNASFYSARPLDLSDTH